VLLKDVRIRDYRSVEDSGVVPIDIDVTCFVGKNESGKTAFLQALHLLNPLNPIKGKTAYDEVMDYPSRKSSAYKKIREAHPATVVTAVFGLEDTELAAVRQEFGPDCLTGTTVTVEAGYYGNRTFSAEIDVAAALKHLTADLEVPSAELKAIKEETTVTALKAALQAVPEPTTAVTSLASRIAAWRRESLAVYLMDTYWAEWLPVFFYFDDYSTMRGRVSLPHIKSKEQADTLEESEKTFLGLLATVDADLADFETTNFERLTRELEGAANGITDKVFEYWTQNKELRLEIRVSAADPEDEPPLNQGPIVNVRIYNPRHRVSVPFDERSRGFVWFFSFFAYFSDVEQQDGRRTILLLDEPGLALHATAQGDFLRFIDDELARTHQVLYTTHSPSWSGPIALTASAPCRTSTAKAPRSAPTSSSPTARRSSLSRPRSATSSPRPCSSARTAYLSKGPPTCCTSRSCPKHVKPPGLQALIRVGSSPPSAAPTSSGPS